MKTTTNLGLKKIELTDSPPDITVQDTNWDSIDKHLNTAVKFSKAGGTGTAITLSEVTLEDGYQKTFIVTANNSSAATKINGKNLYKPGGTAAPTLTAGKAVTVWYDSVGDCFFIKASAEGDAVATNVLATKKFSNDNDTGITGTMVNNGPASAEIINLTSQNQEFTISSGFHTGLRKIKAFITNLLAGNIKAGVSVGGVTGTFTSDSNAVAGEILPGKTAYVNGNKVTGNMPVAQPDYGDQVHAPTISVGAHSGDGTNCVYLNAGLANKFNNGINWVRTPAPDLLSQNILAGKNILGVPGALSPGRKASGSVVASTQTLPFTMGTNQLVYLQSVTVSGLTFKPSYIVVIYPAASGGKISFYKADGIGIPGYSEIKIVFADINYGYVGGGVSTMGGVKESGNAYVNTTGFRIPIGIAGVECTWLALE